MIFNDEDLVVDYETVSIIDLKKCGVYKYAEDAEILCYDHKIFDINGCYERKEALDCHIPINFVAHNANFDRMIQEGLESSSTANWLCTQAIAAYYGLPRSLKELAEVLNLTEKKADIGHKLILKSIALKKKGLSLNDEDLESLKEYCKQDVQTTIAFMHFINEYDYPEFERKLYKLDQEINDKGIKVNTDFIHSMNEILIAEKENILREFKEITGIERPSMRSQLLKWFYNMGLELPNTTKATLAEVTSNNPLVSRVIALAGYGNRTSNAKYKSLLDVTCNDGRARGLLNYFGTSTGRWSGRYFQPHNLPRGKQGEYVAEFINHVKYKYPYRFLKTIYGDLMEMASSSIRSCLVSSGSDHILHCVDFSSIETRVLFWLAEEQKMIDSLAEGKDIYKEMASAIYNKLANDVSKEERHLGKTAILGLGYGLGADGFIRSCKQVGIEIDAGLAQKTKDIYRAAHQRVVNLWHKCEKACRTAIIKPGVPQHIGSYNLSFIVNKDFLQIKLPSGRNINFYKPYVDNENKISYLGRHSTTKRFAVQTTYGGKLVGNIVQALARDVLGNAMLSLDKAGFNIVFTVHDEIVCDELIKDELHTLEIMSNIMITKPPWATELPLAVEGFSSKYYRK